MKSVYILFFTLFVWWKFLSAVAPAQTVRERNNLIVADSLGFKEAVRQVIATHPAVIRASEAVKIAEAGIGLAKSSRLPDIDVTAGYTFLEPLSTITIPGFGTYKMGTANNFNSSVNIRETLFDFNKSNSNIRLQKSSRDITAAGVELVKQQLVIATALNYYSLVYFQEALKIKNLQIETLQKHLDFVSKKEETGSATKYEILSTQVRLSAAESQKVDIETARQNTVTMLNSLLGLPSGTLLKVKNDMINRPVDENQAELLDYANAHRTEVTLAGLKQQNARLKLAVVKTENNPVFNLVTSGGYKNGYFPSSDKIRANYLAGLSLKVSVFDATRRKYHEMQVNDEMTIAAQDQEQTLRDISVEVYQNYESLKASSSKIQQSELQVRQAEEARKLAELSFKTGTITNLDLLDAETLEAESRLTLLKARSDYAISQIRLDVSLGKSPY